MNNELVSVVVVCYNSSEYILECLDSINNQIYERLELIVTDDCSTDNTRYIAQRWIDAHAERFERAIVVKTDKNVGVAGNCNRGLSEVNGAWVKMIAGDDLLCENCISTYAQYVTHINDNVAAIVSDVYRLEDSKMSYAPVKYNQYVLTQESPQKQCRFLSKCNIIAAPSVFLRTDIIRRVEGWDEDIPLCEDAPMWIKLTSKGYLIRYIQQPLVIYRVTQGSLVQKYKESINKKTILQLILLYKKYKITTNKGWFKINFIMLCKLLEWIYRRPSDSKFAILAFKVYKFWFNIITKSFIETFSLFGRL